MATNVIHLMDSEARQALFSHEGAILAASTGIESSHGMTLCRAFDNVAKNLCEILSQTCLKTWLLDVDELINDDHSAYRKAIPKAIPKQGSQKTTKNTIFSTPECGQSVINTGKIHDFHVLISTPFGVSFWRCFGSPNGGQG